MSLSNLNHHDKNNKDRWSAELDNKLTSVLTRLGPPASFAGDGWFTTWWARVLPLLTADEAVLRQFKSQTLAAKLRRAANPVNNPTRAAARVAKRQRVTGPSTTLPQESQQQQQFSNPATATTSMRMTPAQASMRNIFHAPSGALPYRSVDLNETLAADEAGIDEEADRDVFASDDEDSEASGRVTSRGFLEYKYINNGDHKNSLFIVFGPFCREVPVHAIVSGDKLLIQTALPRLHKSGLNQVVTYLNQVYGQDHNRDHAFDQVALDATDPNELPPMWTFEISLHERIPDQSHLITFVRNYPIETDKGVVHRPICFCIVPWLRFDLPTRHEADVFPDNY